jgi:uncharacterized protein (TIGR00297 family)
MAGWSWGAMLVAFFVTSTGLGRIRTDVRAMRIGAIVAKGGRRDAMQVLANGGAFALAAVAFALHSHAGWMALGAGALAAATADTWATEIGSLARANPRSVLTGRVVPAGTSGGITVAGTTASVAGASLIATIALLFHWPTPVVFATLVGGIVGSVADSLLGAAVQSRRWCDQCELATEQESHVCGNTTRPVGGVTWMDNDMVNLLSGLLGAATALLFVSFFVSLKGP